MLKPQLILLLSLLCFLLKAQEKGYLITRTDSASYEIKFQEKSNKTSLFFRKTFQETWHEVYASNAESAGVIGEALYLSLQLPDTDGKVWVKCILDGEYRLVEYRDFFYAVKPDQIIRLDHPEKPESKSRFLGQMISLFSSEIDFDFRELSYHSKSLVKPFIQYHEKNKLPYVDYNRYHPTSTSINAEIGISSAQGGVQLPSMGSVAVNANSVNLGMNMDINFPNISKKLLWTIGLQLHSAMFNDFIDKTLLQKSYFVDLDFTTYSTGIPIMMYYKLVNSSTFTAFVGAGVEVVKNFPTSKSFRLETMEDNVVQTEFHQFANNDQLAIYQTSKFLFGIPNLSESFNLGVGLNLPVSKAISENYVFTVDRSLLLFVRYNF